MRVVLQKRQPHRFLTQFLALKGFPHLTDWPGEAVANVRDTKAEAFRAALGVPFLQVIESWFASITMFPLNILLQIGVKN